MAANVLADRGWSVLVLEAADHPGGAVHSEADVVAPGYVTDLFSAFYPLAAASPIRGRCAWSRTASPGLGLLMSSRTCSRTGVPSGWRRTPL